MDSFPTFPLLILEWLLLRKNLLSKFPFLGNYFIDIKIFFKKQNSKRKYGTTGQSKYINTVKLKKEKKEGNKYYIYVLCESKCLKWFCFCFQGNSYEGNPWSFLFLLCSQKSALRRKTLSSLEDMTPAFWYSATLFSKKFVLPWMQIMSIHSKGFLLL